MKVMHTAFKNNIHCSLDYTGRLPPPPPPQKKKSTLLNQNITTKLPFQPSVLRDRGLN